MRTTKIIIYPLMLILLFPVTAFAAELPETVVEENQEEKQEEPPVENAPEVPSQPEPIPEPDPPIEIPESPEPETTVPETVPQETEPGTEMETQTELETETGTQTEPETETEEPETLLDEDTKGLLKEYLTSAVSGNSTGEAPVEPENTEYQTYIQEALQVLQDNSTTLVNVMLATCGFIVLVVGLVTGLLLFRRMR